MNTGVINFITMIGLFLFSLGPHFSKHERTCFLTPTPRGRHTKGPGFAAGRLRPKELAAAQALLPSRLWAAPLLAETGTSPFRASVFSSPEIRRRSHYSYCPMFSWVGPAESVIRVATQVLGQCVGCLLTTGIEGGTYFRFEVPPSRNV